MPLVHSIQQVFTERAATDVSGRPDPDSRHNSADGVDNLRRNALGLFRARLGFFEAGVKLSQVLFRCGLRRFPATSGHRLSSTALSLFCGCHMQMLAEIDKRWKITRETEKANLISQTGL